ncbi:hypothetical protein BD408DRAFT_447104 [Parasitella parasitica]|nr:hypothetical protein BD408DRAFT_447104 [Parasitella parasitica]
MEFQEVNNYIAQDSDENKRKSVFSGILKRLKRKTSTEKFNEFCINVIKEVKTWPVYEVDPRIHDPLRIPHDVISPEAQSSLSDDSEVVNLVVLSKEEEKKTARTVYINETANQIQPTDHGKDPKEPHEPSSSDRFISVQDAIVYINEDIELIQNGIEMEIKRIIAKQQEIMEYQDKCHWMHTQMDAIYYSILGILRDNIPEMISIAERMVENEQKVKLNKKKNSLQKHRFEKHRKTMNFDTRLAELRKKTRAVWRRDKIWNGIRDWGFLILFLFAFVNAATVAY